MQQPSPAYSLEAHERGAHGETIVRINAVWDHAPKRPPKAGEWYLSGAIIQAWRARKDLKTPFHIARLVKTRTRTVIEIVE